MLNFISCASNIWFSHWIGVLHEVFKGWLLLCYFNCWINSDSPSGRNFVLTFPSDHINSSSILLTLLFEHHSKGYLSGSFFGEDKSTIHCVSITNWSIARNWKSFIQFIERMKVKFSGIKGPWLFAYHTLLLMIESRKSLRWLKINCYELRSRLVVLRIGYSLYPLTLIAVYCLA